MNDKKVYGPVMDLTKACQQIIDVNEKSRKKIKTDAEDVLFASHIISQNPGKLQATIVAKLSKNLMQHRLDKGMTDVVVESVVEGKKVVGDITEALKLFQVFKKAGCIELDSAGKLLPVQMKEVVNPLSVKPKSTVQTEFEIRRGIEDQSLPNAVKALSKVNYFIDDEIRQEAESFGFTDYANNRILATSYEQEESFNVHYFADSRLRVYPNHNTGYSPQGSDLGKAIIKNETLVANKDLTPLFIKQAEEFMDGECPFKIEANNLLLIDWKTAPKYKFRMLQLQRDFREYLWTGATSANVDLDARCSGSQILSGLGKCDDITAHIGMELDEHDLDLYERHAQVFTELVAEIAPKIIERNSHLLDDVVNKIIFNKVNKVFKRKVAKRPTMTFVYNATLTSIIEEFRDLGFHNDDVVDAAKIMQKALHQAAGGTALIMDWLKSCAKIISHKGHKTIQWTRLDGRIACQTYVKLEEINPSTYIKMTNSEIRQAIMNGMKKPKRGWEKCIKIRLRVPHLGLNGDEVSSPEKHVNGITANFVHSIDSWVAMRIIDILDEQGIQATRFVHDSISVHMNYRDELYAAVIKAHIELFESNYLEQVKEEWEMLYGVQLPELPEQGNWNPQILNQCERFWE